MVSIVAISSGASKGHSSGRILERCSCWFTVCIDLVRMIWISWNCKVHHMEWKMNKDIGYGAKTKATNLRTPSPKRMQMIGTDLRRRCGLCDFACRAMPCHLISHVAICRIAQKNSLGTFGDLGQGSAASVKVGMQQRLTNPNRSSNNLSKRFSAYHFVWWESTWYLKQMCRRFFKTETN